MSGKNYAIDIGTSSIKVFSQGKGILLSQSCAVSYDSETKEVISIGNSAMEMLEKQPSSIEIITPIKSGIISDYNALDSILSHIILKLSSGSVFRPNFVICVPSSCTDIQKKTIIEIACSAGAGKVGIVEEPVASAYGCAADADKPFGTLVVDIGAGTTDIAVITMGSIFSSSTLMFGGDDIDDAIIQSVRYGKRAIIGKKTAEKLKKQIGFAEIISEEVEMSFSGKNAVTDLPEVFNITNRDLVAAINPILKRIMDEIRIVIEQIPSEMYFDICNEGMILSGGTSKLKNIDKLFSSFFSIPVRVCSDAENTAVKGAGYLLRNIDRFEDVGYVFKIKHLERIVS